MKLRLAALSLLALSACSHSRPSPSRPPDVPATQATTAAPRKQKLVVLMVVDQLPAWTFGRHASAFRGAFARLIHEGTYFPQAEYPYALTVTAIGHAALVTGAPPRGSGIIGNSWFDRGQARWIDVVEDSRYLTLGTAFPHDDGASPHMLMTDSVGEATGKKVVTVSYKERAAVLMGGHKPHLAVWYEPARRAFVTSTYYAKSEPGWLTKLAVDHPVGPRLQNYVWNPLPETASRALVPDDGPGETGGYGLGPRFPHPLQACAKPEVGVGPTPLAIDMQVEAALAALDGEHPDFLAFSLSTHDYAAHSWGQESWEATDVLFRMDQMLVKFLDGLDTRYGKDGWTMVFTSDHGGPPMPERVGGWRIDQADIEKAAETAAIATIGPRADGQAHVLGADDHSLYLRPSPPETIDRLRDAVAAAIAKVPGVELAVRADKATDPQVLTSIYPSRSGDVYFSPQKHNFIQKKPFGADTHGTRHEYDRQVPLVIRDPSRPPRLMSQEHPSILRVAPTLARFLSVRPPKGATESAL